MARLFSSHTECNLVLQEQACGLNGNAAHRVQSQSPTSKLFDSFWMAGFESSSHVTKAGVRLDMIEATQHDQLVLEDYRLLREFGFGTIRDAVRWHLIDRGSRYDFSSLAPMVEAAQKESVQVIWDICHYGWPDGVDTYRELTR